MDGWGCNRLYLLDAEAWSMRVKAYLPSSDWSASVLMLPILLLGAILRFAGLSHRGFLYWDEGKFALEGVRLLSVMQALPNVQVAALAGKAVGTAKPTHALLIALSYALFGVHDYSPLFMDAAASVLAIAVLFLFARRLFGVRVALLAAAFLAVSGYDLIYARSALSESDADLLFLVGVLVWWVTIGSKYSAPARERATWVPRLGVGLIFGLAFTTNYRMIVYIGTLVAIDVVEAWKRDGWREAMSCMLVWPLGCFIAPLFWQSAGILAMDHGIVLFRGEVTYRATSYLSEAAYQLHGGKQSGNNFSPLPYLQWYVARQGWPLSILLLVGLVCAALKRSYVWLVPALLVIVPYCVYVFAPFIVPRNLDATLPFGAVLMAAGLTEVVNYIRFIARRFQLRSELPLTFIAGIVVLTTVALCWPLTEIRSGYAQAASYVTQQGGRGAIAVNEVMRFYLRDPGRGCDAPRLPGSVSALVVMDHAGYHYAIIDSYEKPLARYLSRHARVVRRFRAVNPSPFGENLIASENGDPPSTRTSVQVTVYALAALRTREVDRKVVATCNLDQLS